jgi:4-hydroxy-tetrahydrodipicolinate synthase
LRFVIRTAGNCEATTEATWVVKGIWAAVLTPVGADLIPDASRALPYYRELIARGCDGINLLGTTGEAMSLGASLRIGFMEAIAASGLPMHRVMSGTGAASLEETVALTRTAFELGFAAALVMPPVFFREASDDGIVAFFDALFARVHPPRGRVLLYNFPRMSGIPFHPELVDRLLSEFPGAIGGIKDSSNDPQLQREILARHPEVAILPGSESDLRAATARGAAGCISGSVALWPELARAVFAGKDEARADELARNRAALDAFPFVPAVRYLTARTRNDPLWERALPPQSQLSFERRRALADALAPVLAEAPS